MPILGLVLSARDMDPVTAFGIVFKDELVEVGIGVQLLKPLF